MNILYRRFFLVATMIAAMGVLTANLILETRSANNSGLVTPGIGIACKSNQMCKVAPIHAARGLLALVS